MTRLSITVVLLLTFFMANCKPPTSISTTAYVIGPNDISTLDAGTLASVPPNILASVVLLTITINQGKRKFCSGTLIPGENGGNLRVLTNHHCFAPEEDDKRKVTSDTVPSACEGTHVFFGFIKDDMERREVSRCQENSFRTDFQGDLGIFTLSANPSTRFKAAEFWNESEIPAERQGLIVHFPTIDTHDVGADKNLVLEPEAGIKLPVAQITVNDCETLGVFPAQEWGLDKSLKMGFKHSCDLKKGSSGSGLWDKESGKLLGVNWGGITLKYTEPDRTEVYNVATSIKYVKTFLNHKEGEELQRLSKIEADNKNLNAADAVASNSGGSNNTLDKEKWKGCAAIALPHNLDLSQHLLFLFSLLIPVTLPILRLYKSSR